MNMWSPWIFLSGMVGLCFGEAYPYGGQCAVCLEEGCKTGVSRIILAKFDETLWQKENKIPECSVSNPKPDAPCMMSNGNLVLRTEQTLHFEGKDGASGGGKTFHSTNMPCADLDLPPSLKSSSGAPDLNQINATANPTTTHASAWPPWKIAITVCGSVFAVIVIIGVSAIVIYRRRHKRRREGQDGERPPDNNVEMDPLNRDDEHS
ncbi:uncharacterized protein LOC118213831 isoform X1 [Anguilla anguilla]|uniref:uncharacterized protein LOC118213831 isoform X1 n=1 Tax=Anguilla anguilla TaxID=7936 RepID=UPI0015B26010|nr:uncharacterized protein LOC118213831 isoform X1 [Anguilla anguilla]XP_035248917.1 uncharacterized protein LOC118213831 isoform X1 [Anguilla anguilla]